VARFAEQWLRLREPYDHAARSGALAARFAAAVGEAPRILDLGCGTGSNLRYLSPRLGDAQTWLCFDHDPALLASAAFRIARWGDERGLAHTRPGPRLHLRGTRTGLDVLLMKRDLSNPRRAFGLEDVDGVTASALLDLTSADWLDRLARRLGKARVPVLFALSFDGRLEWRPSSPDDETIRARFNAHQHTDKGFGPALGPDAAAHLADRLEGQGFRVRLSPSDWRLDAADRPLLATFSDGLTEAVRAVEDDALSARWCDLRREQLRRDRLHLTVGHLDLLGLPA
jgi:SAM-dependent methyltransferase